MNLEFLRKLDERQIKICNKISNEVLKVFCNLYDELVSKFSASVFPRVLNLGEYTASFAHDVISLLLSNELLSNRVGYDKAIT